MGEKKEKTKQLIIENSIKLFSSLGYNATTTASIAQEVGLSETIIFKYFKNKENLLREISNLAMSQIIENISIIPLMKNIELSKDYSLRNFIKSIIMERLEFMDKNFELVKLFVIEMQYSKELLLQAKEIIFPKAFEIFEAVRKIIISKASVSDAEVSAITRIAIGTIESIAIQKYLFGLEIAQEKIEIEVEEILNIIEKSVIKNKRN